MTDDSSIPALVYFWQYAIGWFFLGRSGDAVLLQFVVVFQRAIICIK
jgi:hypothetical protein